MSNRCYLRGLSVLGLFNTLIGCLFNRVLVIRIDSDTDKLCGWLGDLATNHPPTRRSSIQSNGGLTQR